MSSSSRFIALMIYEMKNAQELPLDDVNLL